MNVTAQQNMAAVLLVMALPGDYECDRPAEHGCGAAGDGLTW